MSWSADTLNLAPGLHLDADYIGGATLALLGKKGAGKSFTTRVLAEEFWAHHVPFALIDPMGANWGLRSSRDGKHEGIPVPIFGGAHGDAPLERTAGAVMADLLVGGLSMILDLSELGSRAAERQFGLEFFERLYRRNSELRHVLLDEADLFAPQKPAAGDQQLLGITENIVRRGRNRGIAITLISQRPAVVNKDVLTQVDGLFLLRITSPQDREAARTWMDAAGDTAEVKEVTSSLAQLQNGETWAWIPELGVFDRVQIRMADTFDSSPTRKRGAKAAPPKGYADVDLTGIRAKIAGSIERAQAEDPKALRKRIRELEAELKKRPTETKVETITETVEVQVVGDDQLDQLRDIVEDLSGVAGRLVAATNETSSAIAKVTGRRVAPTPAPRQPAPLPTTAAQPAVSREPVEVGDLKLGKAHKAILAVLDQRRGLITSKRQVAVATGYAINGGGFNNPLGALRTAGLIEGTDPIAITDAGAETIDGQYEPLPTGQALLEHWCRLGKAHGLILRELAAHYPNGITKQELADATGYAASGGGFNNPLGKLRTLELIEGRDELRLTEAFGDEVMGHGRVNPSLHPRGSSGTR